MPEPLQSPPSHGRSGAGWALVPIALLALAAARQFAAPITLNHDTSWYLYAAEQWLDGARVYVEIVDVNLPWVIYLLALPAYLARQLGVDAIPVLETSVLALATFSTFACRAFLRGSGELTKPWDDALWTTTVVIVLFWCPGGDFGQREHLFAITWLPLAVATGTRLSGYRPARWFALLIGVAAGAGVALKPQFALVALAVHALVAFRRGARALLTPENAALWAVVAAYLIHLATLPAAVWRGMRATIELALATYGGTSLPLATVIALPTAAECILLGLAVGLAPGSRRRSGVTLVLAASWLVTTIIAIAASKGWSYHFVPARTAGYCLLCWVALGRAPRRGAAAAILAALFGFGVVSAFERCDTGVRWAKPGREVYELAAELRATVPRGSRVAVLDTQISPSFPLVLYLDWHWVGRLPCLWPVAGLLDQSNPAAEHWLRDSVVAAWVADPPDVVLVRRASLLFVSDPTLDLLAWARRDPRWAKLLQPFVRIATVAPFDVYRHP